jgi:iron complex outermembrane receptor protein
VLVSRALKSALHRQSTATTVATAIALALGCSAANAQQQTENLEEIIVTGFRSSLNAALDIKRDEAGIVDAIKAEDIADFPDANLAESIQRIPGVAITRDAGEGRQISVRGLGPQFTRIRINGMEALTTTGGADASGGVNRSRSFDFNVFASDLFNSITVRKTASADVEEGSLGATIDLQTARPFDYDGATFAVSSQIGYNDLSENFDPRAALLISNTFADGKFGALFSAAYSDRSGVEQGHSTVRWSPGGANGGFNAASTLPGYTTAQINNSTSAGIYHPRIPRYNTYEHEQERLGVTASFQFQPADSTLITLDALYAKFDAERSENYLEAIGFSRTGAGKPQIVIRDGVVNGDNELVYGVFDNVDMRVESRFDVLETQFKQLTASLEHSFTDAFSIGAMAGYADSDFDNPIQTTITLDRRDSDGFSWDYRGDDRLPVINWGFDPSNPANWTFGLPTGAAGGPTDSDIRIRPQGADNSFTTAKLHTRFEITDNIALKGGVDWREYEYSGHDRRRGTASNVELINPALSQADLAQLVSIAPGGNGTPAYVIPNYNAFVNRFGVYSNSVNAFGDWRLFGIENPNARGAWQEIKESEPGAWVQADFNFDIGIPIRGNLGVRYVETQLDSVGWAVVNNAPTRITADNEYSNTLPSLNLTAEVTPELLLRFGAAKVITRPGLGDLSPGGTLTITTANRNYNTNNPYLDPTEADALDLGAEWYFAEGSLLGVAVFYKDISSFNSSVATQVPYNQLGLPLEFLTGTGVQPGDEFTYTRPVSGDGGEIKGVELNFQQQFSFLPAPWNGFGVLANYTHVESDIDYPTGTPGQTVTGPLVGLSEDAANGTLYYENDLFSIRVSASYRDQYATRIPGRESSDMEGTNATMNYDMAASFNVTDNIKLTLEALNLTDEYNDQFIGSADQVVVYQNTGRQYFFGVRFGL